VVRARAGDASVLPRLGEVLDGHPEVWRHGGDLERAVVRAWAELLGGGDPLSMEAIRRKADELRSQLAGEAPTPLERLLVGLVVSTWLEVQHAQGQAAGSARASGKAARQDLRRSESAQRRYLAAIRTLTTVRALLPRGLLPVAQLQLCVRDRQTG
jgi:hypothetical protein